MTGRAWRSGICRQEGGREKGGTGRCTKGGERDRGTVTYIIIIHYQGFIQDFLAGGGD